MKNTRMTEERRKINHKQVQHVVSLPVLKTVLERMREEKRKNGKILEVSAQGMKLQEFILFFNKTDI